MSSACRMFVLAIVTTWSAMATAQPFGQPTEEPPPPAATPQWSEVPPTQAAPAQPPPEQPPQELPPPPIAPPSTPGPRPFPGADGAPPPPNPDPGPASDRPDGFSIGIGLGYDLPSDLQLLDTTSVRFRFRSGFAIEPFVTAAVSGTSFDWGDEEVQESSTTQLGLGANFRIPVKSHGPIDFLMVAGGSAQTVSTDPDGDDNDTATDTISIVWGLAVDLWLGRHVSISLTATNPFASYMQVWEEQEGDDATESSSAFGVVFDPDVALLVHLFL